jgi:XTP/dITP diphosphohydrolase
MPLPTLFFGTHNANKLNEIRQMLVGKFEVVGFEAFPNIPEAPETHPDLEGNAKQKAEYYARHTGLPVFSDDTGLEVDALNGAPGAESAFYAGPQKNASDNIAKLLAEMETAVDRRARFRTVVAYKEPGSETVIFNGVLEGTIFVAPLGDGGFGYDPVFIPLGDHRTLAELSAEEKNAISHRGKAIAAFVDFLLKR